MAPFSSVPEPGIREDLLLWGAAPEEGSSMRSEADVGGSWHSLLPFTAVFSCPFPCCVTPQLISFTGVSAKLAQEALVMTGG